MQSQTETSESVTDWPIIGQQDTVAISRSKIAYWKNHVQRVKNRAGMEVADYSARIHYNGKRCRFTLDTPNKAAAASKAAQIYGYIVSHGWNAAFEKFKPDALKVKEAEILTNNTVGSLIEASRKFSSARDKSFNAYTKAFRRIVAGVTGREDKTVFAKGKSDGLDAWRKRSIR